MFKFIIKYLCYAKTNASASRRSIIINEDIDLKWVIDVNITAQKMKFSFTDCFSKCDQIRRKLRI